MHLGDHGKRTPDKPAVRLAGTGELMTYRELDARSNQLAHLLRARGLSPGDHLAICLENRLEYAEVMWAALRSGLHLTPINWHLAAAEACYIVEDCDATALVTSAATAPLFPPGDKRLGRLRAKLMLGSVNAGWESYEEALHGQPTAPVPNQQLGQLMLYSSGTTGRPKGILREPYASSFDEGHPIVRFCEGAWMLDADSIYFTPAPLYHSASLNVLITTGTLGATAVIAERFDAEAALRTIQDEVVTHVQMVPTMFVRMLKLPAAVRGAYRHEGLRLAIHAAAPCPAGVKRAMIDWWGPILVEYYGGSENVGMTMIDSHEWLSHPGSVGRPLYGEIHILDERGEVLPAGQTGDIFWEGFADFEYHKDPERTRAAMDPLGRPWATYGDIGHVDEDGYLYVSDRRAFTIIRGGVNIYPKEAEDVLVLHPCVADVAVIGVPDPDLGEEVKAVVQPVDMSIAGADLEDELLAFCRERLSPFKCPRSIDFDAQLPRSAAGKLVKATLRARYAAAPGNS
jgi:long-chain acyl-CoA synthetase